MAAPLWAAEPPQRLIIKYTDATPAAAPLSRAAVADSHAQLLATPASRAGVQLSRLRSTATGAEVVRISGRRLQPSELQQMIAEVAAQPGVQYVEEDRLMKPLLTPDDPLYSEQWGYYENKAGMRLPQAWDMATGTGVIVAVIDTGYRPHADLVANIVGGYDFISDIPTANDGDGRDADASDPGDATTPGECSRRDPGDTSSWHGTHVSGTIAAVTNNGLGVAGVAFNAKVLPLRVLGRCGGYTSDIADAIIWASGGSVPDVPDNPNIARVINMSLGGDGACDNTSQQAINTARANGTVVIVAAGNDGRDARNSSPANCAGVVAVAAVNRSGGRAYYSNYGKLVDVAAPGGAQNSDTDPNGILSTLNDGATVPGNDSYVFYQGTSMATPQVAGVAALMLSKNPALTPDQVEAILKSTARPFPATCSQCGAGIVDAAAAVTAAAGGGSSGGGGSTSCAVGYQQYTGTLTAGGSDYAPDPAGYSTSVKGQNMGLLSGPANANFDLYLENLAKRGWRSVSKSTGSSSSESINYKSAAGTYRFRVDAKSGSGDYLLCIKTP